LSERGDLNGQIQDIEGTIQTDTIATTSVVHGSRVIDAASAVEVSARKTVVINAASGLVAGLALAAGGFTLLAVLTTRVHRRSDVAAALLAPVAVSVGPVVPPRWRQVLFPVAGDPPASRDLQLIVRHLLGTLAAAPSPALVIVAIDNLDVTTLAVRELESRLAADRWQVSIVNETARSLPRRDFPEGEPAPERDAAMPDDVVVLVLATLDPAKGAEHLREWGANAVAFVTAGRSPAAKLETHAIMIRRAGLRLSSVVLIAADPNDDSLGIFEPGPVAPTGPYPVGVDDPAPATQS
jgi:hypothetical protein